MTRTKKILLLYISVLSGHHRAAMALEKALRTLDADVQIYSINSFNYTNPILEKVINKTYNSIIKNRPEVWEYLYDNPKVVRNTQRLKDMIHRFNSSKMKALIEDFKPDVIVCTQAFPCGMVADYKTSFSVDIPLVGVLTDFYPHSYWVYEAVDKYVVASEEAKTKLLENGVGADKIHIYGIPIDIEFNKNTDTQQVFHKLGLNKDARTVLIMGGSGGLGPIIRIVHALDKINSNIQIIVVTGTNARLQKYFSRRLRNFRKKICVIGYADNMNELMSISDMLITKPGGLTVSEALSKGLALIIINPIPGQEAKNTQFLLKTKAAIKANNEEDLATLVESICSMPYKLTSMKQASLSLGKPDSAINIAKMILEL